MTIAPRNGYFMKNCCMTSRTHPTMTYELPASFQMASERYIIVRECFATIRNAHMLRDGVPANVSLHASFPWEGDNNGYVCIANHQNAKKKCFQILDSSSGFAIWFAITTGERVQVDDYIFDFLLKYR
jgi:hypothetical protein